MTITVAFLATIAVVIGSGLAFRRLDESRNLRFTDEAGSGSGLWALARVDARRMALHPAWLITLGFFGAVTLAAQVAFRDEQTISAGVFEPFTLIGIPLGGLALIVTGHRLGTRSRRNGLDELEASTPTAPRTRTLSLLAACLAPLPVAALAAIALGTGAWLLTPLPPAVPIGSLFDDSPFLLVVVGGAVVGVLLSRWLPVAAAPLLGIVAVLFLNNGPDHLHPRYRWLRPMVELNIGGVFDIRPERWQAVFIVGLIGLGSCLALLRHPPRAAVVISTVVAVGVIGSVGWIMTRPPSAAQVAEVVDRLERPEDHQQCVSRPEARYCTYPGAEEWVDRWAPAVDAVVAQVPAPHRPVDLMVVQREPVSPWIYLDEVQAVLEPKQAWSDDGRVHPSLLMDALAPDFTVAWQVAATAVDLPAAASWRFPSGCMAGGQARQVLSLVLAARATPTTRSALRNKAQWVREEGLRSDPVSADTAWDYSSDTPSVPIPPGALLGADGVTRRDFIAVAGASGWGSDLLAAEALLGADQDALDALIESRWDDLVDPSTTSTEFLTWVAVEPAPGTRPALPMDDPRSCP